MVKLPSNHIEAALKGNKRYFTGKPCKKGHVAPRRTVNRSCVVCEYINTTEQYKKYGETKEFKERGSKYRRKYRETRLPSILFNEIKSRAKLNGIPFNISVEDIQIPQKCPVLGIDIIPYGPYKNRPSVDKIDNSRGYVKGNVAVISLEANRVKSNSSIDSLKRLLWYMETLNGTISRRRAHRNKTTKR